MNKALLQLHIAILLWGATGVLGDAIKVDAIWVTTYRTALTIIGLLIFNLYTNQLQKISWQHIKNNMLSGTLLGLHWVCFFASIKLSNVAVALICLSCASLFTSLIQSWLNKIKLNKIEILLSLLAISSIALLFYADFNLRKGVIYGILSALFVAAVPVLNKKQLAYNNATTITLWNMVGGFLVTFLCIPFVTLSIPQNKYIPSWNDILLLLVLAWVCTIVTYQLSLSALKTVNAFTQTLLLNLEPIYGIILAAIFLDEHKEYNIYFYIGIALLIATIILQTIFLKKKNAV